MVNISVTILSYRIQQGIKFDAMATPTNRYGYIKSYNKPIFKEKKSETIT
jgi:hypothetical protein